MAVFTERECAYRFRIAPEVIFSWGINEPGAGIPRMERRTVSS